MIPAVKTAITISLINTVVIISFANLTHLPAPNQIQITGNIISSTPSPIVQLPAIVQPSPDSRCLIKIRGQIFNITEFRKIHSGGDIFQCGTDMTITFNNQHNDVIFSALQKYAISL